MPNGLGGVQAGGAPIAPPVRFLGGTSVEAPAQYQGGAPIGGPASLFNIGGAPIAVLGGVFSGGLPLGGPVTQVFRGGSGPTPPTLFVALITSAGPIGGVLIGTGGAPVGEQTIGGGGLPISAPQAVQQEEAILQPRTALVGSTTFAPPPALAIGQDAAGGGGSL